MNNAPYGRFTHSGGPALEQTITKIVAQVGETARRTLSSAEMTALLVLGGYGRGEGGVDRSSGEERLHNNIDFLVVSPDDRSSSARAKERFKHALTDLEKASGVGFDISFISMPRLKRSGSLVIWYDARFGHKLVIGEHDPFTPMTQFSRERIPPWDVRNLITNRGTLLLINDHIISNQQEPDQRMLIRHAMKAIIGYGDALLFFLGDYDWSYREKRRRTAVRRDVSSPFRELYDTAMGFRFEPTYDDFLDLDLPKWLEEVRAAIEPVHRLCESRRLGVEEINWDDYLALALSHALRDDALSLRAWAKKGLLAVSKLRKGNHHFGLGRMAWFSPWSATIGGLVSKETNLLSLLFPLVAYPNRSERTRALAQRTLGAASSEPNDLRSAYLHTWARHGDINFGALLTKVEGSGLRLSGGEP